MSHIELAEKLGITPEQSKKLLNLRIAQLTEWVNATGVHFTKAQIAASARTSLIEVYSMITSFDRTESPSPVPYAIFLTPEMPAPLLKASEEMAAIESSLKYALEANILIEVVWAAQLAMKINPKLRIAEALLSSLREWL